MALCSLSTGSSSTPWRATAAMTTSPAATRTSLFASAIFLPCSIALIGRGQADDADRGGNHRIRIRMRRDALDAFGAEENFNRSAVALPR